MGEAWSDWYAEDYLAGGGFQTDTAAPGEIRSGTYENAAIRHSAVRLPGGIGAARLPGHFGGAGPGGYTYGDFGENLGRSPRCTTTARSGSRRSGICARP